jgi:hypothetical protein
MIRSPGKMSRPGGKTGGICGGLPLNRGACQETVPNASGTDAPARPPWMAAPGKCPKRSAFWIGTDAAAIRTIPSWRP